MTSSMSWSRRVKSIRTMSACALSLAGCAVGQGDDASEQLRARGAESGEGESPALPALLGETSTDGGARDAGPLRTMDSGQAQDASAAGPPRDGGVRASIAVNGTGCPDGTTSSTISADEKTFTTTYARYEAALTPTLDVDVKDCQLAIAVHGAPAHVQYAIEGYRLEGRVDLEQGVEAAISGRSYFQGDPAPTNAKPEALTLTGPRQSTFTLEGKVESSERVWSPCGLERDVNLVTRLVLSRGGPGRSGKVSARKSIVKITQRSCK